MMFSPVPFDRMGGGLWSAHGLGLPLLVPPTCGRDLVPAGTVVLVGGTIATPLGAKVGIVGTRIVPSGTDAIVPTGVPSRPAGSGGIVGVTTPPAGSDVVSGGTDRPDPGDDLLPDPNC